MSSFLRCQRVCVRPPKMNLLVGLVVDRDDPAFSDGHGDITISHGEGVVARLGDCSISFGPKARKLTYQ